ncbi:MAG: phosphatase PAP2 family protein [Mojavia pulchra JT2-VF2]|jgi:undecaprenyl-diphosphatase|uniref:Phosphatase PAP2 family protein n=1 Tax=Mojavia pulchra JT2-VF2 TaxID=287848 RepID=A0A951PZ66_9NOST|nr:phosphatase PAP2 family protein [Mojavia pulchra JT2-VF2]
MGTSNFEKFVGDNLLVRAIHTAVKGRARYKVDGLYGSQALKQYLELRLSKEEGIAQVSANNLTGNILVIFHRDQSPSAIAWLIYDIVLDYRKKFIKLPVTKNVISTTPAAKKLPINISAIFPQTPMQKLGRAGSQQLVLVSGAVCALVCGLGLLHISGLDERILLAIQKLHTPIGDRIMLGVTFLGEPLPLLLICLGLGIWSTYNKRLWEATTLGITAVGAMGLNYLLKARFGRARPALWDWIIDVAHYSFPSGHAMASIAIYGFISYTLAKQFPQWQGRIFSLTMALIVAIGFSRLYLGVHWPTDVAAGYALGLVWLIACILSLELWQQYQLSAKRTKEAGKAFEAVVFLPQLQIQA